MVMQIGFAVGKALSKKKRIPRGFGDNKKGGK